MHKLWVLPKQEHKQVFHLCKRKVSEYYNVVKFSCKKIVHSVIKQVYVWFYNSDKSLYT